VTITSPPSTIGMVLFAVERPAVGSPKDRARGPPRSAMGTSAPELAVRRLVSTATGGGSGGATPAVPPGRDRYDHGRRPSLSTKKPRVPSPRIGRSASSIGNMLPP